MYFQNRADAGRQLSARLAHYKGVPDLLVLALPRGGVPVAVEVANALGAPLDVFLVRKLGVPGHEELAMGAIASGGEVVLNQDVVETLAIPRRVLMAVIDNERRELERREHAYRDDRPPPAVLGKTVILVDDGLATGSSMRAAVRALRQESPAHIVIGVPVSAPETCNALRAEVDEILCVITPDHLFGVGAWYEDFSQTSDAEVREALGRLVVAEN